MKEFIKKNFTWYHVIGIVVGISFAIIYWLKVGQFKESMLKNSLLVVIIIWSLIGYITMDFVKNAKERNNKGN